MRPTIGTLAPDRTSRGRKGRRTDVAPILSFLADTLARWGAAMQRPLHPPAPLPPPFSVYAYEEEIKANLRRIEEAKRAAAEPALLPSTDYRTSPRPASVVTLHHGWTGGGAALPWLCGSGPADTSHPR